MKRRKFNISKSSLFYLQLEIHIDWKAVDLELGDLEKPNTPTEVNPALAVVERLKIK